MLIKTEAGWECLHCLKLHKPRYRIVDGEFVEIEPECDHSWPEGLDEQLPDSSAGEG